MNELFPGCVISVEGDGNGSLDLDHELPTLLIIAVDDMYVIYFRCGLLVHESLSWIREMIRRGFWYIVYNADNL